jgi:hypothetical protein
MQINSPRVSICLPNLNTLPYLPERISTILSQSFVDWELLVYDGYSSDGSWEYFCKLADRDRRMRVWQGPREGTPGSWTPCIRAARGEFVYIATSDDTMSHDCIEKLVKALDENPDCDLAHCPISIIDERGDPGEDWWTRNSLFAKSSGELLCRYHKRIAPFDGILCLLGDNIYTSVTQLLIRKSLFHKIGFYQGDWGSVGDFHWNLRAGLVASTVHVPDTWGGWRVHSSQATACERVGSLAHQSKIDEMISEVLQNLDLYCTQSDQPLRVPSLVERAREMRSYLREHSQSGGALDRRLFVLREAFLGNSIAWRHLASVLRGQAGWSRTACDSVRTWFGEDKLVSLE